MEEIHNKNKVYNLFLFFKIHYLFCHKPSPPTTHFSSVFLETPNPQGNPPLTLYNHRLEHWKQSTDYLHYLHNSQTHTTNNTPSLKHPVKYGKHPVNHQQGVQAVQQVDDRDQDVPAPAVPVEHDEEAVYPDDGDGLQDPRPLREGGGTTPPANQRPGRDHPPQGQDHPRRGR